MLDHTEPQLDIIIEQYAKENPKELTATRLGEPTGTAAEIKADVAWADVLIGSAREEYLTREGLMPPSSFWSKLRERLTLKSNNGV
jgi:hypothetical protein